MRPVIASTSIFEELTHQSLLYFRFYDIMVSYISQLQGVYCGNQSLDEHNEELLETKYKRLRRITK